MNSTVASLCFNGKKTKDYSTKILTFLIECDGYDPIESYLRYKRKGIDGLCPFLSPKGNEMNARVASSCLYEKKHKNEYSKILKFWLNLIGTVQSEITFDSFENMSRVSSLLFSRRVKKLLQKFHLYVLMKKYQH